ncbi:MAG: phosphatidate cytidylyltransferase [Anaerolineales bacterium]|nr:phosphatidate cytidylyltransferase [Anaerolineales bacterium]
MQDLIAVFVSFLLALFWLRVMDFLAHRGLIEQKLSRKIIHIGTGPIFLLCWNFFSSSPSARFIAALIPLAISAQFFMVGMGWMKDPAAVQAMSRTGDRREILRGPLYYGIMFILLTIGFWRTSPVGILALMILCGGDGFADIFGRKFGDSKLPFNHTKSWVGSAGMFLMSFLFGSVFILLFNSMGYFTETLPTASILLNIALISLAAAVVEALTKHDLDNITITLTSVVLGLMLF